MSTVNKSTERLDALRRCCEAYGADAAHWPEPLRAEFTVLYQSVEAQDIRREAEALDGFLNVATAPRMPEDLQRRMIADFGIPEQPAGLSATISGLMERISVRRLVPAGALAGLGALGVASGMMTASAQTPLTPEDEALIYVQNTIATIDDEGMLQWDVD